MFYNFSNLPIHCDEERGGGNAKLSIYWSVFVSILTYGHKLSVVMESTRLWVQAAEMYYLYVFFVFQKLHFFKPSQNM